MPIHFRCPHCDKLLALGKRKGGTQLPCPLCNQIVTVPPRTEVELPTTIVAPSDAGQAWWLDAATTEEQPKKDAPPAPPPEAWWVTPNALPNPPLPPPSQPPADPLLFESPHTPLSQAITKTSAPVRAFPLGLVLLIVITAILALFGIVFLLLARPTAHPSSSFRNWRMPETWRRHLGESTVAGEHAEVARVAREINLSPRHRALYGTTILVGMRTIGVAAQRYKGTKLREKSFDFLW